MNQGGPHSEIAHFKTRPEVTDPDKLPERLRAAPDDWFKRYGSLIDRASARVESAWTQT